MTYRGTNYGTLLPSDTAFILAHPSNNKPFISLNYQHISNATAHKQDIVLEMDNQINTQDCLCEIRLHVEQPKKEKQVQRDQEQEQENEEKVEQAYASTLYKMIVDKAKIGELAGESIATFEDINLAVPRGKYTVDFYENYFRFHGLTFNHMIEYKNITRGFILPLPSPQPISIVLQLHKHKPLVQGQTVYNYIIIHTKKETINTIKTRLIPEIVQRSNKLQGLKEQYEGPQVQVFAQILYGIAGINLISPGQHYRSTQGYSCLKATVKAQQGWLFMLKNSFVFINKPVMYFRTEDIQAIEITKVGMSQKTFDMRLTLVEDKKAVEFVSLDRADLDSLVAHLKERKIKVLVEDRRASAKEITGDEDEDQSDDEDFQEGQGSQSESSQDGEVGSEEQSQPSQKVKKPKKEPKKQQKGDSNSRKSGKNSKVKANQDDEQVYDDQ